MAQPRHILAIDQGTTSSRAIVFAADGTVVSSAQKEFRQYYPQDGWVEHDAEEIIDVTFAVCRRAIREAAYKDAHPEAVGITNQRETVIVWERDTGRPIHKAIVWQDRRTTRRCEELRKAGHEKTVSERTGLLIDPYFSSSKLEWLLDTVDGARKRAEAGDLAFGTIDTFLLWHLTGGKSHRTDATNACRTSLFNIHEQDWDPVMLDLFSIPAAVLPEIMDCCADFGTTTKESIGVELPVTGMAGDQQAAAVGQACFHEGMIKSTYGTGCFALMNTGDQPVTSKHRLLTTVAYRIDGVPTFSLEGSIFIAGAAIQWLRDGIGIITSASESEKLARSLDGNKGVYLVPAFTGLGAPHWDANARGAIFGLTRDTGPAEITRAALEAVCYQTRDLMRAMVGDGAEAANAIRVDGGMVKNDWLMQFLADIVDAPVERPVITETTALGAAYLAGLTVGVYSSLDDIAGRWKKEADFAPSMQADHRKTLLDGWDRAVARTTGC